MMAQARRRLGQMQFTALLAASMSMAALGIDLLLPAFGDIRADLGLAEDSTAVAGLVTTYFLGLAVGQLFYGPASDSVGRKPMLYLGFGIYGTGALLTAVSPTLPLLLASRFLWGLGAAGPRTVTVAVIRDRFEGDEMSRAMSLVMSVFMLVPVFAPTIGAVGVGLASWRWLFVACAVAGTLIALWSTRLQETLPPEQRRPPQVRRLAEAARMVVTNRVTVGYTLAMTLLYGGFTSYLASSEIIFGEAYDQGARFPLFFGGLAVVMAAAMLTNARIVRRVGASRLANRVMGAYLLASSATLAVALTQPDGLPPLPVLLVGLAVILSGHAIMIPNFNTLAMGPMGSVAGMASSVTGAVQVAAGALLGSLIDNAYDGTVVPLLSAVVGLAVVAAALMWWAQSSSAGTPATIDGTAGSDSAHGRSRPTAAAPPAA